MVIVIAIMTFLIAAGKLVDNYMLKKEKVLLYRKMEDWTDGIANTSFPKMHLLMIDWAIDFYDKNFNWKVNPIRATIFTIVLSWILTTVMYHIGGKHPTAAITKINNWHDYLPWYPVYIVNFIFDIIALYVTARILKFIRGKNTFIVISGVLLDFAIAYFLLASCMVSANLANDFATDLGIGQEFVNTSRIYYNDTYQYSASALMVRGIKKDVIRQVRDAGFTSEASFYLERDLTVIGVFKLVITDLPKILNYFIEKKKMTFGYPTNLVVYEGQEKISILMENFR